METLETERVGSSMEAAEPVTVWIEAGDGSIARGVCEILSEDGALVTLAAAEFSAGESVSVRIAANRATPTLGATARILAVRPADGALECELEWTHSGPEREQLAYLVAASLD